MFYLAIKALISGVIVAAASEIARKWPGIGGLIVSLPLVSLLTFIWLWRDTRSSEKVAELAQGAFWFFLPSLPMFLALPAMLRAGINFWAAFAVSVTGTALLYLLMFWLASPWSAVLGARLAACTTHQRKTRTGMAQDNAACSVARVKGRGVPSVLSTVPNARRPHPRRHRDPCVGRRVRAAQGQAA